MTSERPRLAHNETPPIVQEIVDAIQKSERYTGSMDGDLQQLVDRTGLAVPLAAQIVKAISDSGASQLEISVALNLVGHLRHLIDSSDVPA